MEKEKQNNSSLIKCCEKEVILEKRTLEDKRGISCFHYTCSECGRHFKVYPSEEGAKSMDKIEKEQEVSNFLISELSKRGYYSFWDPEYDHHGEVILRVLQDDLSSLEMKILAEVKGDKAIIYLQPETCCSLADDEVNREPIKLPLLQLPINTKDIKYFDYFPSSWKNPTWRFKKDEVWEGTLKSIWEDRKKSSHLGTYFPKAKEELMEELKNKGFQWEGGKEKDNYLKAVCPRCSWDYEHKLTEKYLKVEESRAIAKAVKNHEC